MINFISHCLTRHFFGIVCTVVLSITAQNTHAICHRVNGVYTGAGTPPENQILPGEGFADAWQGACSSCGGDLGLSSVINVTDASFQPLGSVIDSSVTPFAVYGRTACDRQLGL